MITLKNAIFEIFDACMGQDHKPIRVEMALHIQETLVEGRRCIDILAKDVNKTALHLGQSPIDV